MIWVNYLVVLLIVIGTVEGLSWSPYAGALISIVICSFINFFMSKYWVFRS